MLCECLESEDSFRSLWQHLDTDGIEGESRVAAACVEEICRTICEKCGYVVAFHGCRVYTAQTYREYGIQSSNTESILRNAIERFGSDTQVRKIYTTLQREGYTCHNGGKVYGVKSIKHHMENGGLCHAKGSELLGIIASRMSPNTESSLYRTGEPSIIEYLVSVNTLKQQDDLRAYAASLLQVYISHIAPYNRPDDPRCGGLIAEHDISPDLLIRRYLCNDDGYIIKIAETYNS